MSGWLEFFEIQHPCPVCGCILNIPIVEDGNPKEDPKVIQEISGGSVQCPMCGYVVTDKDLMIENYNL